MAASSLRRTLWMAGAIVWLATVSAGLAAMGAYANRPGTAAAAAGYWPDGSGIQRDPERPTLVMLAHPKCDCTRASLAELAELIARAERRPKTIVVFIHPHGVSDDWEQTDLWRLASAIPDVVLVNDEDGRESRRFGGKTSGQTLFYDRTGRLRFSGGATIARGHLGDNPGVDAMLALLRDGVAPHTQTPVFGCALNGRTDSE